MKKLIIIILAFSLTGCLTPGRIERNCPKFAKLCITETEKVVEYRDTTIYRTDTIRVPLPYKDTVRITDTIRIINNKAYLKPVRKQFGLVGVDAWVNHSVLGVKAWLTDSTILHTRRDTITLEKVIKEEAITKTVTVKHIPPFHQFTFWWFIAQAVACLLFVIKIYIGLKS